VRLVMFLVGIVFVIVLVFLVVVVVVVFVGYENDVDVVDTFI